MHTITSDVGYVDLEYQGESRLIATDLLETEDGLLLVDPGPETTLDTLRRALQHENVSLDAVHAVLLTHIHLDHAGATGRLVEDHPTVQVYVHERGARWRVTGGPATLKHPACVALVSERQNHFIETLRHPLPLPPRSYARNVQKARSYAAVP
jgi:glyoxylase-like metal-dependent hydrolase (beta-lactamase superfamily II)